MTAFIYDTIFIILILHCVYTTVDFFDQQELKRRVERLEKEILYSKEGKQNDTA
jgi:hypothetical protein